MKMEEREENWEDLIQKFARAQRGVCVCENGNRSFGCMQFRWLHINWGENSLGF